MNELPPPDPATTPDEVAPPQIDAAMAQRLEALARRRQPVDRALVPGPSDDQRRVDERLAAPRARRTPTVDDDPAPKPRRRHPAHGARRAALGLSLASTGGLAAWFGLTGTNAGADLTAAEVVQVATPAPIADSPAAASSSSNSSTAPTAAPPAPAFDTVVDGAVYRNKWGNVQVQATFDTTGSLVDVTALQTPTGGKSNRINDYAVPRLTSEALTTQSADVDTVSGATYTSIDYRHSLQSAIDAARAAGATQLA